MFSLVVSCVKVALILGVAGWLLAGLLRRPDRDWIRQRALWIMPAIFTVAMAAPSIWVIFAFLFLVMPLAARRREDIAPLLPFAFLGIPYMSQEVRVGGSALLTLASWHCVFLGAWLAMAMQRRSGPRPRIAGAAAGPFILLYVLTIMTEIHGANLTTTVRTMIATFMLYGIPFLVVVQCLRTPADLRRFAIALLIAIALQAVIGIYQSRSYWPVYENIFWSTGIPMPKAIAVKVRAGMMRATASYLESNSLAGLSALGFILALGVRKAFTNANGFRIMALLTLAGVYATVSRGGFVFAGLAWLGFEAYRGKWGRVGVAGGTMAGLYLVASLAARFIPSLDAFTGGAADSQGTADYRRRLLDRGLEEIRRSPIFGYDWASINVVLRDLRQGEGIIDFVNGYILAGITGGVGAMLTLFLLFVIAGAQLYSRRGRWPDETTANIAAACFGVQVATSITCFTSGFFGNAAVPYAMLLGVGALLTGMTVKRRAPGPAAVRTAVAQPLAAN